MQFMTYWKLNEAMSVRERQEVASSLVESGQFPPENVDILRWDATPDGWGVLITEADSAEDVMRAVNMWRVPAPGFFETTQTAPAQPVEEVLSQTEELLSALPADD